VAYVALLPQVYRDRVDCFKRYHQQRVVLQIQIQSDATMICISEGEDEMDNEITQSQSERGDEDDTLSDIPKVGFKRDAVAMTRPIEKRAKRC
jgi:hypothetical protein